ncbi:MAG: 6-phosphofructokinase [bacterium]|nr:6-phosphofructokinase [bacterium]
MSKCVGILTSGGDNPGLNAAIRGLGKAGIDAYNMQIIGFRDGFRGIANNRYIRLDEMSLSGILTVGGTILGTSRDKPHRMPFGDKELDMTDVIVENYHKNHLDVLVCIGGGGTQKNAFRLMKKGLNIITLPKTIDNDVAQTDVTFGFDTALGIATEAIDRLHSTAHSHHRIIVVEIMGHRAGWLALGAGIAGGADVILIPEIPYDVTKIAEAIVARRRKGKHFSIVAVAEGAMSIEESQVLRQIEENKKDSKKKDDKKNATDELKKFYENHTGNTYRLAQHLQKLTVLESRVTILGYIQRGGTPSAVDRLLATRLGSACAKLIHEGVSGVMVASHGKNSVPVPLEEVAGNRKIVPLDHEWIYTARMLETNLGD